MLFGKDASIKIDALWLKQLVGKMRWFSKKWEKIILSDAGRLPYIYKLSFAPQHRYKSFRCRRPKEIF
jgi:hypothetical protein